ncbi:iron complex outermembrane recepter protein [bacterium A37T11]|nr:iron complex outermembrane recepter protein [bacterium A37T11]
MNLITSQAKSNSTVNIFLFLLFFSFLLPSAYSQNSIQLSGNIYNELRQPLKGSTVTISHQNIQEKANEEGAFSLKNVKVGKIILRVSMVGYVTQEKHIDAVKDITNIEIILVPSEEILQTVEITGRKEASYKNSVSFVGSKTATQIKDIPQTISYITKETMADQGAVRMVDVIKNVSGVNMYTFFDDITIRGFRNQSSGSNQLFNGMRTFGSYWRQPLLNYLERVEIIKGPASALYGYTSPGGTVNKVTKKPLDEAYRSVSFTTGSYNTVRMLTDMTGPANASKSILYRINLGYENKNSFRDLIFDKNIIVAPSISFIPNEKTRINVDAVYNKSNSRLDRGQPLDNSGGLYSTPISTTVAEVNDHLNEETYLFTTSFVHEFNDNISFNASYLRTGYNQDVLEHRNNNGYAKDMEGNDITSLIMRQTNIRINQQYDDSFTAYINIHVKTGSLDHKIVFGYDYANSKIPTGSSQSNATGYLLKDGTAKTKYVVKDSAKYQTYLYEGRRIPKPNTPSFDLNKNTHILQDMSTYVYSSESNGVTIPTFNNSNGIYLQDQLKIGNLQMLLGIRYDRYMDKMNYKTSDEEKVVQHAFIPRVGAIYTINKHVNAYATYVYGYNPQSASDQSNSLAGGPFDPVISNLEEVGIKSQWFNNRLSATASLYRIEQNNSLISADDEDNPDLLLQLGKDISKGVEFEIMGNILSNLSVIMNYSYNDSKMAQELDSATRDYVFEQKPNVAKHMASGWIKYDFINEGPLKGFGIGAGANYVGKRLFGRVLGSVTTTSFFGPSYLLLNAAVYYRVNRMQLQANFNNITNKTHWVGGYDYFRMYPGAPFNWQTTITYNF